MLIGDTSSSTLLSAYPQIAQQFPNQIACIFIRNTSATDPDDKLPYDTSEFKNIDNSSYFFYRTAEGECAKSHPTTNSACSFGMLKDLANLDIPDGQCKNSSVPQNITFGEQGGVLGNNGAFALGASQYAGIALAGVVAFVLSSL